MEIFFRDVIEMYFLFSIFIMVDDLYIKKISCFRG